ncbi:MAG: enoyl-CoA hydratase-related protein [Chitinophagaceae bacterium]|jgi:2-(1,2-epoxy-1,2-dihydrophenyl)acetyl-CoA isomerase|nr:enoyl-CoA hydratase-related protein [Chitinophagaceae bacterium]
MSTVLLEIREAVAVIRLNRPDKLNAFNREMSLLLQSKLDEVASLKEVRCVVLTGAGKGFSAGQDLAEVTDPQGPSMSQILSEHYNPIIRKIRNMPKPVVAAVNGVAAGAGANIALCCDVVVASASASFIQAFTRIGLIPDSGGTWFLPRLIGWQKALSLAMLGDKVGAIEAERLGMVYDVYHEDEFEQKVTEMANRLSGMPTRALALVKHAFNQSMSSGYEAQLELEDRFQQEAALTYDYREGVEAFMQKRSPVFRGE